jgi:Sporulation protein family 7
MASSSKPPPAQPTSSSHTHRHESTITDGKASFLSANSYTANRLQHSTPLHMHLTSRTLFIGPTPKGWTQRKEDSKLRERFMSKFKEKAGMAGMSRKALTFSAADSVERTRRVSGLDFEERKQAANKVSTGQNGELGVVKERSRDSGAVIAESSRRTERQGERKPRSRTRKSVVAALGNSAADLQIISPTPETNGADYIESREEQGAVPAVEGGEQEVDGQANGQTHLGIPPDLKRSRTPSPATATDANGLARASSTKTSSSDDRKRLSTQDSNAISGISTASPLTGPSDSTSRLLPEGSKPLPKPAVPLEEALANESHATDFQEPSAAKAMLEKVMRNRSKSNASNSLAQQATVRTTDSALPKFRSHIRFDLTNEAIRSALMMRAQMAQHEFGSRVKSLFHEDDVKQGEIMKMEKMLVREDITSQKKLPHDFDENTSQGVVSTTIKKWREFMMICRRSEKIEGARYVLQAYKTRVSTVLCLNKLLISSPFLN